MSSPQTTITPLEQYAEDGWDCIPADSREFMEILIRVHSTPKSALLMAYRLGTADGIVRTLKTEVR